MVSSRGQAAPEKEFPTLFRNSCLLPQDFGTIKDNLPLDNLSNTVPEELVEISMLHVLKDHNEGIPLHTDTIELNNVFMLEVGQQLSLTMKILACIVTGIL